ncbi:MAG: hemolysin III family protein [Gemmatimonadota bacterium]|nr:hemolysin III family protein [Gemmatimonadota bacterium]
MRSDRPQSVGEEIANSVTHGVGLVLSVAALAFLVMATAATGDPWRVTAASVYGTTLVLLYATSTLYHALPGRRVKAVFQRLDHAAIYLLIAGTYTPFVLVPLRGGWGWSLLGVVWGLGVLGVVFKSVFGIRLAALSTVLYLGMGWLVVIAAAPLATRLPSAGLQWLVAGGVLYTLGVLFFAWDRIRYLHAVWHLFVLAGSAAHFCAVSQYALGSVGG